MGSKTTLFIIKKRTGTEQSDLTPGCPFFYFFSCSVTNSPHSESPISIFFTPWSTLYQHKKDKLDTSIRCYTLKPADNCDTGIHVVFDRLLPHSPWVLIQTSVFPCSSDWTKALVGWLANRQRTRNPPFIKKHQHAPQLCFDLHTMPKSA